jgi:phosphate-selective porin OprO and OprP
MIHLYSCWFAINPQYFSAYKRSGVREIFLLITLLLLLKPARSPAQDTTTTLDNTIAAGYTTLEVPRRQLIKWNEYKGPYFTLRLGGGLLYDVATYSQGHDSEKQFDLRHDTGFRDFRFTFKGRLGRENPKRQVTYTVGVMYDGPTQSWLFRETGLMFTIPELWGHVFVGRTKEGFSLNKVMVGYAGWTMERATISDATIPILGDGVKWLGYLPNKKILWNVGFFFDSFNQNQAFSSYSRQVVTRLMWLPKLSEAERKVFHIGLNFRYGKVDDDTLQLRSRPEVFLAPYFVDTGKFPASHTLIAGWEVYHRQGPWLFGTEYWFEDIDSPETGNPLIHGGEIVATWLITGETRPYNTAGGFFKGISPDRTVFEGGPGAWEAVLRLSYIDLDDAGLHGGKFWRITPMINWHMSDNIRLEFAYGYGRLNRFNLIGGTQFFQGRIQLQL